MNIKKITRCLELFRQTGCTTNLITGAMLCGQIKGVEMPLILVGTERNKREYINRFEYGSDVEFMTVNDLLSLLDNYDFTNDGEFFDWMYFEYNKSDKKIKRSLFVDISAIYFLLFKIEKENNIEIDNMKEEHYKEISNIKESHHKEITRIKDICVSAFSLLYRHDID